MSDEIRAEFLSYEQIRERADEFLATHHPEGSLPTPIELIVEARLGMDIVPIPGLRAVIEAEGFTTSDLSAIYVDQDTYERWTHRYRFTLAHEVGHVVLHESLFRAGSWTSLAEWKAFVNRIPDREHQWIEWQAYSFGGLVLVPGPVLKELATEAVDRARGEGLNLEEHWDFAWSTIAAHLAKKFEVSTLVIEKRLQLDGVREQLRDDWLSR